MGIRHPNFVLTHARYGSMATRVPHFLEISHTHERCQCYWSTLSLRPPLVENRDSPWVRCMMRTRFALLFASLLILSSSLLAQQIRGDYLETRSADVYT